MKKLIYIFVITALISKIIAVDNKSKLFTSRPYYYRHQIIKVYTSSENVKYIKLFLKDKSFKPFKDMEKFYFKKSENGLNVSFVPLGFKPKTGRYKIKAYNNKNNLIYQTKINIIRREQKRIKKPFHTWTVEYGGNLNKIKVDFYNNSYKSSNIKKWMEHINIDNIFYMVGQTNAKLKNVNKSNPWIKKNLNSWKKFTKKYAEKDFITGGYIGCFLAFGPAKRKFTQYDFSYDLSNKYGLYKSNFINVDDYKRIQDILKLSKKIDNNSHTNFVGLDYIRAGQGGFGNFKEFSKIFNIKIKGKNRHQKISYLAKNVKNNSLSNIKKKWQYFRAYKTAKVIEKVDENVKKPIWAFTLGWEQGHCHGQDPIMFSDAGADVIFVMLYEANHKQHDDMMKSWNNYLQDTKNLQLVAGQDIDFILNDARDKRKQGPEEMLRRYKDSYDNMSINNNLKGFFIHDVIRSFYGRLYSHSSEKWLLSAAEAFTYYNSKQKLTPIKINSYRENNYLWFTIKNRSNNTINIKEISFYPKLWTKYNMKDIEISPKSFQKIQIPVRYLKNKNSRKYATIIVKTNKYNLFDVVYFTINKSKKKKES